MQYASCMPRACTVASPARIDTHVVVCMYICTRDEATTLTDAISLSLWVFSYVTMMQALLSDGRHAERERERESHMHRDRSKRLVALGLLFTRPCMHRDRSKRLVALGRPLFTRPWMWMYMVYHHVVHHKSDQRVRGGKGC
jgi:hypothetical protein